MIFVKEEQTQSIKSRNKKRSFDEENIVNEICRFPDGDITQVVMVEARIAHFYVPTFGWGLSRSSTDCYFENGTEYIFRSKTYYGALHCVNMCKCNQHVKPPSSTKKCELQKCTICHTPLERVKCPATMRTFIKKVDDQDAMMTFQMEHHGYHNHDRFEDIRRFKNNPPPRTLDCRRRHSSQMGSIPYYIPILPKLPVPSPILTAPHSAVTATTSSD